MRTVGRDGRLDVVGGPRAARSGAQRRAGGRALRDRDASAGRPSRRPARRRRRRRLLLLGAPARPLAEQQDQAVDEQEDARGERLGEDRPEDVLEREARDPDRDGREDDEPGQALVGGRATMNPPFADAARRAAEEARGRCAPSRRGRTTAAQAPWPVQRDDVGQVERRLAGALRGLGDERLPASADPGGHEHRVPEAGDGEQLRHALDECDYDGLQVCHGSSRWSAGSAGAGRSSGLASCPRPDAIARGGWEGVLRARHWSCALPTGSPPKMTGG